jgi:hypothetical protein
MRHFLLLCLFALTACATVTASVNQDMMLVTEPAGATCSLSNKEGMWVVNETPGSATVRRSFSPLKIRCNTPTAYGETTLEPHTRGRAYGNILLLGVPAVVDASTGAGYEYDPDEVTITLQ